ncbi:MAG TPA: PQQ-binding-like beta-propeller repeat protein [Pirellulaceae bacterium]|nr:PQQ-binding-like beta-propeller repeat protein [Pirellulaceae bacterium]
MVGLLLPCSWSVAEDWPTYLKDNSRVGVTGESLKFPLHLQWQFQSTAAPELAWEGPREEPIEGLVMKHRARFDDAHHVAIVGNRVYFGSSVDHQVRCVDAATGKTMWRFFTGGPVRLAPTVDRGRVYFGSDDGCVYCLDAASGNEVWQQRVGPREERLLARGQMISRWPIRTGVLIADEVVYFGAGIFPHETVYLCAAEAATGKLLWKNDRISQRDAQRDDLSPQGYLLANEDLLFVPSGNSLPAAFNRKTGEHVYKKSYGWRNTAGGEVGGTQALLSDGQLYSAGSHHFLALSEKTGAAGFAYIPGQQLTFRGTHAYIATGKEVIAVDRQAHTEASVKRQELFVSRGSFRGNRAKLAEIDRQMADLAQAGILWKQPFAAESSIALAGNAVLVGGMDEVRAYDLEDGREVWTAKVDGEVRGLAIASGKLVVSTTRGSIYTFAGSPPAGEEAVVHAASQGGEAFPRDEKSEFYERAARDILTASGVTSGYCLVLGNEEGRLACELSRQAPKLRIYAIEPDETKVQRSRERFAAAGWYGTRVTVFSGKPDQTGLSNYFANLVVSDSMLMSGKLPATAVELGRYVKPCGGVACFGVPRTDGAAPISTEALKTSLASVYLRDDAQMETVENWVVLRRGKLAGAGDWSHQYGSPDNACFSNDERVKGSLGVLWYGDPGPNKMINRHEAAAAPLSTNGRFFSQGIDSVRAYDAYNGQFLWEYKNPGAIRTGVFNNNETSNLAASDDSLFVVVGDTCTQLDAATGRIQAEHKTPPSSDGIQRDWGYVAHHDGILYGTSTIRSQLSDALRRRGRTVQSDTDAIFAVDLKTGERLWSYRGPNIMHVTITIGERRMYFVESTLSQSEREALLKQDKTALKDLSPEEAQKKVEELKKLDVRTAVALDAKTGEENWRRAIDVTNCTNVSAGGGNLALMYKDGHLLICGANANGHYWRQFLAGDFSQRRLVVLDARHGEKLWSRDANYMNRPTIVKDVVIAEPWAFELHSGEPRKRENPLTGQPSDWQFSRPGHHCGVVTTTPNMMFFRSGFIGYYDLYADSGTKHFAGQRLGCWINAIPSNGLVVIPEASAGCVCLFSITSTVVLEPREDRSPAWGIYSVAGPTTPVKKLAVNLGAPGDRRDRLGRLWLAYPRPATVGRMEFVFDIQPKLLSGGAFEAQNDESLTVENTSVGWIYTSHARGLSRCELPLIGKDEAPAEYRVTLHFAELEKDARPGDRIFDVKLQGQTVAAGLDIVEAAGGIERALTREFRNVKVAGNLVVELTPTKGEPILAGIELERE